MEPGSWKREIVVATLCVGAGLLVLPVAVYFVGQALIGDYAADGGALELAERVWLDALGFGPAAWLLILAPYVLVQVARWVWRLWRPRPQP